MANVAWVGFENIIPQSELLGRTRLLFAATRRVRQDGGAFGGAKTVDFDDVLLAIEIEIVQPPYLLDFGKVYLDDPPPYWDDAQLMANFYEEKAPLFGRNWPRVLKAMASLRLHGIYYIDPRPQNIDFGDEGEDSELTGEVKTVAFPGRVDAFPRDN